MATSGEICADERCQVYLGQQAEYPAMDEAVLRTAGQVLTSAGQLASTFYSANGGGVSASREEGFGPTAVGSPTAFPYLRAARYPTGDANPWSVTIALDQVAARLRYPGGLSSVTVARTGPSGRALTVALDGSAGGRTVPGIEFARALGLQSTLFVARLDRGDGAPAPPPVALQVAPEETATAAVVPFRALEANVANRGAGDDALSPAEPARHTASRARGPTWPEVLMGGALALCLALRHYGRREGMGNDMLERPA